MRLSVLISVLFCMASRPCFSQRICAPVVESNSEIAGAVEVAAPAPMPDVIIIPVVVHVIYNTPLQNISDAQVKSQIAALNNDFRKKNADAANAPSVFRNIAADAKIEFRLATKDLSGLAFSGIVRKTTTVTAFGLDDAIKSSALGGDDAWDRDRYLNIWVGNIAGGIMGYASVPGCVPEKDGVVIAYRAFGTTANVQAPFNKGRTAVHEIGHWLNLRHIWGDTDCGDDMVDDTPPQQGPTRGCPRGVVNTCNSGASGNMYMNFMDFTDDACVNMFTSGQVSRMRALFESGAARHPLLFSDRADGAVVEQESEDIITNAEISLFPNPAAAEIRVRFNSELTNSNTIVICNHLGQVVKQVVAVGSLVKVDVSDLKAGMYFLRAGSRKAIKFIKGE